MGKVLYPFRSTRSVFLEATIRNSADSQSPLGISRIVQDGEDVRLDAEVIGESARCPACHTESFRVHDRYKRHPMDLPWRGRRTRMVVTLRRFWCVNRLCRRRTFVEDCGPSLPPYARRTQVADDTLLEIAVTAGGEGGARMAKGMGLPVSADTMLRLIRHASLPVVPTPRVLGVDDLALRRRYSYATLLVDLESHRRVDLLEGRDAETLAGWLREHPGVKVISRDRSGAYADGATAGALDAEQVADRFHLLQNASQALDGMLRGRRLAVEERGVPAEEPAGLEEPLADPEPEVEKVLVEMETEKPLSPTKRYEAERRVARIARWQRVQELHRVGASIRRIGEEVGITGKTVRRLIREPGPPCNRVLHPHPGGLTSPTLQPYVSYLQDRWQQGCTNVSRLCREIKAMGYAGSRSLLAQAVQPWRGPRPPKQAKKERRRADRLRRRTSMRWTCLKPPDKLKADERVLLEKLLARDDQLAHGYDLLQRFRQLLEARDLPALDEWLDDARGSDLPTFMGLAGGIEADKAAVEAAFRLPWSNGQLEGQVNRVKLIKRQGYGRAKFDLLRRRVLAA
jgi:transposase